MINYIVLGERRSSARSIRLLPLTPDHSRSVRTPERPTGSAEKGLEATITELDNASRSQKFSLVTKFCRAVKKHPQISPGQQERILTNCAEMLTTENISIQERISVCSIMVLLELGPINLSVLGSNLRIISTDPIQILSRKNLLDGMVNEIDSCDDLILEAAFIFEKTSFFAILEKFDLSFHKN